MRERIWPEYGAVNLYRALEFSTVVKRPVRKAIGPSGGMPRKADHMKTPVSVRQPTRLFLQHKIFTPSSESSNLASFMSFVQRLQPNRAVNILDSGMRENCDLSADSRKQISRLLTSCCPHFDSSAANQRNRRLQQRVELSI